MFVFFFFCSRKKDRYLLWERREIDYWLMYIDLLDCSLCHWLNSMVFEVTFGLIMAHHQYLLMILQEKKSKSKFNKSSQWQQTWRGNYWNRLFVHNWWRWFFIRFCLSRRNWWWWTRKFRFIFFINWTFIR